MVLFAPKMIEKFRAQGAEEGLRQGVEIGVEIGVKQEREKWQAWQQRVDAWYQRLQDAQANGQPFNEPPPAPDSPGRKPETMSRLNDGLRLNHDGGGNRNGTFRAEDDRKIQGAGR
jgi:hypothetical protein